MTIRDIDTGRGALTSLLLSGWLLTRARSLVRETSACLGEINVGIGL